VTLADDALDTVDGLDCLDATLEHGEDRALVSLVRRVLARHEAEIRRCAGKSLSLSGGEICKDSDPADFLGTYHFRRSLQAGSARIQGTAQAYGTYSKNRPRFRKPTLA
jgi:hypothetical protein